MKNSRKKWKRRVFVAAMAVNIPAKRFWCATRGGNSVCAISLFLYSIVHAAFWWRHPLGDHEAHIYSVRTEAMKTFCESTSSCVWRKKTLLVNDNDIPNRALSMSVRRRQKCVAGICVRASQTKLNLFMWKSARTFLGEKVVNYFNDLQSSLTPANSRNS